MTAAEQVQAIADFALTERQARFLVLVLRHAGVCVPRQHASFSGLANGGRRCNAFFDKLVRRGYANEHGCVHNRARLYHLHHKPLYHVIGDVTSRYRRRVSPRLAVERLMWLDAVLTMPKLDWLTTAAEEAAYVARLSTAAGAGTRQEQPAGTTGTAPRRSSTFPIGLEPDGRAVLLYLATEPWTDSFRSFLQEHAALLRVAPTWTVRLVFPRPLDRVYDAYQTVIREECESPLHPATIGELQWYFEHRRKAAAGPLHPHTQGLLDVGAKVFGTPRFTEMYRRWLKHGNAVFESPSSPVIAEALSDGRGRVESVVLPHSYRHLSPLVSEAAAPPEPVEKGLRRGTEGGNRRTPLTPVLNPLALNQCSPSASSWSTTGTASTSGTKRRGHRALRREPRDGMGRRSVPPLVSGSGASRNGTETWTTPAPAREAVPARAHRVVHISVPSVPVSCG